MDTCKDCKYAEIVHADGVLDELWCYVEPEIKINVREINAIACRYFQQSSGRK